jgi:hypothetical protein
VEAAEPEAPKLSVTSCSEPLSNLEQGLVGAVQKNANTVMFFPVHQAGEQPTNHTVSQWNVPGDHG